MAKRTTLKQENPKLQYLKKRMNDMVMIAAEKASGHLINPGQYPLPPVGKKSLERAIYDVVMALPKRKRDDFIKKFKDSLNSNNTKRKQKYGDLHAVNLNISKSIAEQVRDLPMDEKMKITSEEAELISGEKMARSIKKNIKTKSIAVKPQQAALATKLDFIVDSLTANQITDRRKDEISLGAFAIDAAGTEADKEPFFISKFKEGETVSLGAKGDLFSFLLDDGSTGGTFPQTFVAGLFLIEADLIHNKDLARKLSILFVTVGIAVMTAGGILMAIPGGGTVLGIIVYAIGGLFFIIGKDVIRFMAIDDFGIPASDSLVLDAPPTPGETFNRTIALDIEPVAGFITGKYTANVRWVTS